MLNNGKAIKAWVFGRRWLWWESKRESPGIAVEYLSVN